MARVNAHYACGVVISSTSQTTIKAPCIIIYPHISYIYIYIYIYVYIYIIIYIYMNEQKISSYIYIYTGFLPLGGMGGKSPPTTIQKFAHSPPHSHLEKLLPSRLLPPLHQTFILPPLPPLCNNFQVITQKNSSFSCSHCSCSIFVLISYTLDLQIMLIFILIDV